DNEHRARGRAVLEEVQVVVLSVEVADDGVLDRFETTEAVEIVVRVHMTEVDDLVWLVRLDLVANGLHILNDVTVFLGPDVHGPRCEVLEALGSSASIGDDIEEGV